MAVCSSIARARTRLAPLAVPLLVAASVSCASARRPEAPATSPAPARAAPTEAPTPDSAEVDALERDLTAAENEIVGRLGTNEQIAVADSEQRVEGQAGAGGPPRAAEAAPPPARSPAKPSKAPATEPARDDLSAGEVERKKKDEGNRNDCQLACRAMASMRRSATRICEIVSEGNDRCTQARRRVVDAQRRIDQARCACSP